MAALPLGDPRDGGFAVRKYILVYKNVSDIGHSYPDLVVSGGVDYSCPTSVDAANSGCSEVALGNPVRSSVSVNGLTNGALYRARILAVNERGASPLGQGSAN